MTVAELIDRKLKMSDKYIEIVEATEDVLNTYEDILDLEGQDTYEVAEEVVKLVLSM